MSEDVYGRPCRACTDFKQWMKTAPTSSTEAKASDDQKKKAEDKEGDKVKVTPETGVSVPADHHECPPDRMELGNKTWTLLHSVAAYFPASPSAQAQDDARTLMSVMSRLYPCQDCAEDLRADLVTHPPRVTSSAEFSQWMCEMHNRSENHNIIWLERNVYILLRSRVNVKLGKPEFDCSQVFKRWRDGWDDGSCD